MNSRLLPVLVLFMLVTATLCLAGTRVVAVGDVHGALEDFSLILQKANLIDKQKNWIGKDTTLIQTGDTLDRGSSSRAVMDLLMQLERQASAKGGHVFSLLGNHEMMNIIGDLRYVTAEDYAQYSDGRSQKRRDAAYQEYIKFREKRAKALNLPAPVEPEDSKTQWDQLHPLGFFEQREAFSPQGKYGKWLRRHNAIVIVKGTMFVHGGVSPTISKLTVDQINKRVQEEIQVFDVFKNRLLDQKIILPFFTFQEMTAAVTEELEFRQKSGNEDIKLLQDFLEMPRWLTINQEGPLWFRGYAEWSDEQGAPQLENLLKTYGVSHIVVGHTVQKEGTIQSRFGNAVFLIDTGMLKTYAPTGQPSALEIQDGFFSGIYADKRIPMTQPPE